MTQEETNKLLLEQIAELKAQLDALKNNATIPFDIGEAFKARILNDAGVAAVSTKVANTEDTTVVVGVDFGLSSTTTDTVLGNPDGFLQITLLSNIYYIPYYT